MVALRSDAHVIAWEQRQIKALGLIQNNGCGWGRNLAYERVQSVYTAYHSVGMAGGSRMLREEARDIADQRRRCRTGNMHLYYGGHRFKEMEAAAERARAVTLNGKPLGFTLTNRYGGWYEGEYISEYTFGDRRENGVNVRVSYPMEMAQGTVSLHDGETPWYEYPENDWEYALPEARKDTRRTKRGKLRLV